MDDELRELMAVFRTEAGESLATMEDSLLALERLGTPDAELLHATLRAAHTLKGNASIVGADTLMRAAHAIEDTLQRLREGEAELTPAVISELFEGLDHLGALVRAATGEDVGAPARGAASAQSGARGGTLRVNIARLDTLLTLTGEITIVRARLAAQLAAGAGADAALGGTLWQLEQLHAALQDEVMQLRMVPLGPSFRPLYRTVRDLSVGGKEARLEVDGADVEVDTSIAEQIRDPLTHMVRNAMDHGIEPREERLASGKPAAGTITLHASHRGGAVVLELRDDGRGLDRARIAARAERAGLVADASALSDEQLLNFIFEPGFSTAETVSEVSGRGVGMDVVRRHIRGLRGSIELASQPGHGTTITIRLPLTVAIIEGFTVGVGGERYVLPLDAVVECVDFTSSRAQGGGSGGILNLRGSALPYVHLRKVLGLPAGASRHSSVVVVHHGERRAGLVVDALEGNCQAVIKPLSGALRQLPGIAGSTILGDGRVALILHVPHLVESVARDPGVGAAA